MTLLYTKRKKKMRSPRSLITVLPKKTKLQNKLLKILFQYFYLQEIWQKKINNKEHNEGDICLQISGGEWARSFGLSAARSDSHLHTGVSRQAEQPRILSSFG